jgi:type IV pilus assembly protein PilM
MSRLRQGYGAQALLARWLASPPPDAAVEITAERVSAAAIGTRAGAAVVQSFAVEPLAPGAVVPSLTAHNIVDREAVRTAVSRAVGQLGRSPSRVALVIPDAAARVSLIKFDQVPARREDLDQLIRWQVKKSAPFPIEDACVTYSHGARAADGSQEFVVVSARRPVIEEYEAVCEGAGLYAGLVDLATLSAINLFLAGAAIPAGDWMLVHMRPAYTSLVILRGADVLFFRSRPEGDEDSLADIVHQTAMYYEDRLAGGGFSRVLLGGGGHTPGAVDMTRRRLEERLQVAVEPIDPTRIVPIADRISSSPDLADILTPLLGVLMRTRAEAVA